MIAAQQMAEDDWIEAYRPLPDPFNRGEGFDFGDGSTLVSDGVGSEAYLANAEKQGRLWTVLDCDGTTVIATGRHHVNRLGFIVTDGVAASEFIEVTLED